MVLTKTRLLKHDFPVHGFHWARKMQNRNAENRNLNHFVHIFVSAAKLSVSTLANCSTLSWEPSLSGPVRDTPPPIAQYLFFRDSITEGGLAPICLVFIGYHASIAEIPLVRGGGCRTSTSYALHGEMLRKGGGGYRTQLAMLRPQKPQSAQ